MEKTKQYSLGDNARKEIVDVAKHIGSIIGKTLGPSGRNYFLNTGITNDGRTIVKQIRFDKETKDLAAFAFDEIALRADKEAGDGTTTAMVIGAKLTEDTLSDVQDLDVPTPGSTPVMRLSQQLEEEKNKALELLESKKQPTDKKEKLHQVALTAVEDEEGAQIISDAMWEAGKDTFPILELGTNGVIEKDVIDGASYPFALSNASFINNESRKEAVHEDVAVLVVNHAFEEYAELSNFMMELVQNKPKIGALAIVANHFSVSFLNQVSEIRNKIGFPIVPVSRQNMHNDTYQDIAALVDAKFADTHPKNGVKITDIGYKDAGFAKKVIAREDETIFIGGRGKEALIVDDKTCVQKRVADIKEQMKSEKKGEEKEHMEKRIAALTGGIATIYVDAQTATERYYRKLKVEDAMNSCRSALNEGMARGGGVALKEVAEEMGEDTLLYNALREPYDRIQRNHGEELEIDKGVFDSIATLKSSVKNAVSVVKVLITTEGMIADVQPSMVEELREKLFAEE